MADTDDILPEAPPAPPGDAVLDQLARSENIEAYARERADQDQETETGEPVQDADRAARIREAMAEARRDSAEAREGDGLDSQIEDAQAQRAIIGTALEQAWRNRHGSDRPAVFQLDGSRILQAEKDAVLWRCPYARIESAFRMFASGKGPIHQHSVENFDRTATFWREPHRRKCLAYVHEICGFLNPALGVDKSGESRYCTLQAFRLQNSIASVLSSERGKKSGGGHARNPERVTRACNSHRPPDQSCL